MLFVLLSGLIFNYGYSQCSTIMGTPATGLMDVANEDYLCSSIIPGVWDTEMRCGDNDTYWSLTYNSGSCGDEDEYYFDPAGPYDCGDDSCSGCDGTYGDCDLLMTYICDCGSDKSTTSDDGGDCIISTSLARYCLSLGGVSFYIDYCDEEVTCYSAEDCDDADEVDCDTTTSDDDDDDTYTCEEIDDCNEDDYTCSGYAYTESTCGGSNANIISITIAVSISIINYLW